MDAVESFNFLGMEVRDRVTGYTGIVTSICFDLYGCIQGLVHPGLDADGKNKDLCWFDIGRLEVIGDLPVMEQPDFISGSALVRVQTARKGPEMKPTLGKF